jgi:hypothetical protein
MIDQSQITPDMAREELQRREVARQELARRQQISSQSAMQQPQLNQSIAQSAPGLIQGLAQSPATRFISGAGDALQNMLAGTANLFPGINLPLAQTGQGYPYEAGRIAGNIGGAVGLGELSGARAGLVGLAKLASPESHAKNIMDTLSGGKSFEENAKSLAEDIKNGYQNATSQGKALYKPVFDELGDQKLPVENTSYSGLGDEIYNYYDRALQKMHTRFNADPTLQNAHNLQSQLGSAIRDLEKTEIKSGLRPSDRSALSAYSDAQNSIRNDINDFVAQKNSMLANQYNIATENWAKNVVPYIENPKMSQIAKGDITNPRAISNLFKNPESETLKIVEDLGPESKNKILYAELGKQKSTMNAEKLAKSLEKLDTQGLSAYVTPELEDLSSALSKKLFIRKLGKYGAAAAATGYVGSHVPGMIHGLLGG